MALNNQKNAAHGRNRQQKPFGARSEGFSLKILLDNRFFFFYNVSANILANTNCMKGKIPSDVQSAGFFLAKFFKESS